MNYQTVFNLGQLRNTRNVWLHVYTHTYIISSCKSKTKYLFCAARQSGKYAELNRSFPASSCPSVGKVLIKRLGATETFIN